MTEVARPHERVLAWSLVGAQLVLLVALVFLPGRSTWPVPTWLAAAGAVMVGLGAVVAGAAAAGLGSGLTASPLPNAAARLRTSGMFACVRHPIYSGLLLAGAGVVVASGRAVRVGVWLALLIVLSVKARFEERRLSRRFPGYHEYAGRTPRFLPRPARCLAALAKRHPPASE